MNHPHEQQAAAMARAGELTDGEQLRECINSGQVSAAQVVAHQEAGELIAINTTDRALVRESVAYGWRTECLKAEAALAAERADVARLRKALHDAATSLGTVNRLAGRDKYMESMLQVRGYAIARAEAAFDALNPTQGATNHD